MIGLYNRSHFELEEFIEMQSFDMIQLDVWKGIALAKSKVEHGYFADPTNNIEELGFSSKYTSLMQAHITYQSLPSDDPLKITADDIYENYGHNALATFLKYAYKAHDLYSHFPLWDFTTGWESGPVDRNFSNVANHFPTLIQWIDDLIPAGVFSRIGRAFLMGVDCNGYSHEHRDTLDHSRSREFIHIRPSLDRPFYVYDEVSGERHYINSRVGWWNDDDIHGGEPTMGPSYAIRIDGKFTDDFRKKIGIV